MMSDIVDQVAVFLEKNYPCSCEGNDPECPGSYYEAVELVNMVEAHFKKQK